MTPDRPEAYQNWAEKLASELAAFDSELAGLRERFDEAKTVWGTWRAARFRELGKWADEVLSEPSGAGEWLRYFEAVRQLETEVGEGAVGQIRGLTAASDQIPGIVERRILQLWLETAYFAEPLLRSFAGADQRLLVEAFRALDAALPFAARAEVRQQCFSRYPGRVITYTNAGEVQVLRDQISRQRRQLPVRNTRLGARGLRHCGPGVGGKMITTEWKQRTELVRGRNRY